MLGPVVIAVVAFLKIAIVLYVLGASPVAALVAGAAAATYIVAVGSRRTSP